MAVNNDDLTIDNLFVPIPDSYIITNNIHNILILTYAVNLSLALFFC